MNRFQYIFSETRGPQKPAAHPQPAAPEMTMIISDISFKK